MSGTSKRRGENLQPPERRRKLNNGGVGQGSCSNSAGVARPLPEPRQSLAASCRDMLKRSVQETMNRAQATVAVADLLCKETDKENQALAEEVIILRACAAELLDDETVKERSDSILQLLRRARDFRRAQKQKEQGLTAALYKAEAAMGREKSMRLQAQLKTQACEAVIMSKSDELEEERKTRETDEAVHTAGKRLLKAYQAAYDGLTKDHRDAQVATSIALARERERALTIRQQRKDLKDLLMSALQGLKREGTRRETVMGGPEQYEASLKSALEGLKRERAAHKGEAEALASAARTAQRALAEERERVLTIRQQRKDLKDLLMSALQGLKREGTRRETVMGGPEQYEASLKSALEGLKRERAAHKGEAEALASAARTAQRALAEERTRREAAEDGARCVICMSHTRNTMLLPCSHLVLCDKCPRVSECPICRARVRRTIPVILS